MAGRDDGSGPSSEVQRRLQQASFEGQPVVLETIVREARETVDEQLDNSDDVDEKAVRILRVNVLLLGLLATAASLFVQADEFTLETAINGYTALGTVFILVSTIFAAATLSSSSFRGGLSRSNIVELLEREPNENQLNLVLAKSYASWISYNRDTEVRNGFLITLTSFALISGLIVLTLGVYTIANEADAGLLIAAILALILVGKLLNLGSQFDDFRDIVEENPDAEE